MRLSGARKVIYPHLDLRALEDALRQEAGAPWRKVIVTESVFSMDGDIAQLDATAALAEKYGAALIVDEAHATAVHGPGGRGIAARSRHRSAIAGRHSYLRQRPRLCGSIRLRTSCAERASHQSRAYFYLQHGFATLLLATDRSGARPFLRHGSRSRTSSRERCPFHQALA